MISQEKYRITGTHVAISVSDRLAIREGKRLIKYFLKTAKRENATKDGYDRVIENLDKIRFIEAFGSILFNAEMESAKLYHRGEYKRAIGLVLECVKTIKSRLALL